LGGDESGGLGTRLRTARRSAGLTQKQLAEALGVESITVSRWERGVTSPTLPRLRRIAELTETSVSDLVRAPDAASAHAVELAALREELAETRELVNRVARTLDQLARSRSAPGSASASRDS
jgi:transcriptional regulator with XRE-family HTH domain